jgi:EAL domain-containing protein (putative c-di-GMP-specific phosphodiesterase class I)
VTHMTAEREMRVLPTIDGDSSLDRRALLPPISTRPFDQAFTRQRRAPGLTPKLRLRNALENHEFSLHYQPQYQTRDGQHCGIEALARWFPPVGEPVSPTIFIRLAEKCGLIAELGAWVLHEACSTVIKWNRNGAVLPVLCINVSPRQISHEFCAILASTLENTGFPAAKLELEITENILIEKPALALDCLARWKAIGVRIALDDFGTGYSSLSYLSRLPVNRIKIDKSLIHRMTSDTKTAAIVRAVISLGADLGCSVLAEGVESEAQLTMLSGMGCQQVQGYLLAMPACADEAKVLLEAAWGNRAPTHTVPASYPVKGVSNAH